MRTSESSASTAGDDVDTGVDADASDLNDTIVMMSELVDEPLAPVAPCPLPPTSDIIPLVTLEPAPEVDAKLARNSTQSREAHTLNALIDAGKHRTARRTGSDWMARTLSSPNLLFASESKITLRPGRNVVRVSATACLW